MMQPFPEEILYWYYRHFCEMRQNPVGIYHRKWDLHTRPITIDGIIVIIVMPRHFQRSPAYPHQFFVNDCSLFNEKKKNNDRHWHKLKAAEGSIHPNSKRILLHSIWLDTSKFDGLQQNTRVESKLFTLILYWLTGWIINLCPAAAGFTHFH